MKYFIALALVCALTGCNQANIKDLITNVDKDCVIHAAGSFASGIPPTNTVTFTADCKPSGMPPAQPPQP